ncbi:PREDICTED: putative cyclin-B3-1 [Prunus mume]|uniref:B-like cyclin n=1 Tax=Prunus mume TaxID=102107 RepID=A0ABM0NKK0_PRUMU|nr:PREDICTED: putative cyclin-B3-1 [Prunus mume]
MASFKKLDHRQSNLTHQARNKMVAAKPKFSIGPNGVGKENLTRTSVGVTSFKVYSESETTNAEANSRRSVPVNKASTLENTIAIKAGLKSTDKRKGILGSFTANANLGRRALADVSNIKRNSSMIAGGDASKKMNGKSERKKSLQRVSVGTGIKTVSVSSRRSFLGKGQESPGLGVSRLQTSKRAIKDLKAPSDNQRTKAMGLGRESIAADGRRTSRNTLKLIRKSLPVLKVNPEEMSIPKENAGSSENAKEKSGYYVRAKVGKTVVPRISNNARSHLLRNRVSDGFMNMGQANSNTRALPRISVRPILKSTLNTSESQRTLKSKCASGPKKLVSANATSSKTEKVVTSFLPENVKHDSTQGELPSDGKCSHSASSIISRRNSNRRRSYTSLLMTGSKLLEERDEAMKQEELPSIDDDCNQLEVSDYVDEIYQYYWVSEAQNPPLENFMLIQADITPHMRGILVNWLIEVHFKFELMQETLYLMVTLLDQYLSQVTIKKDEMQLVGLTALLLASKYEDFWHPRVKELISISAESYTRDQVLGMEKLMLKKLKFRLNAPTPYVFMLRFLKAAQSEPKLEHLAFYLIELCLVEYEASRFKPSLLCAAALYVARCTLQITPAWTPLLCKHARYDVTQIRDCAEMILKVQKVARVGRLKVTYEKYMRPDLSGVAAIKPLERLPL